TMVLAGLLLGFLAGVGIGGLRGAYESLRDTAEERRRRHGRPGPDQAGPLPMDDRQSSAPAYVPPAEPLPAMQSDTQEPIEEIRANLRAFRRDLEELARTRTGRRYF